MQITNTRVLKSTLISVAKDDKHVKLIVMSPSAEVHWTVPRAYMPTWREHVELLQKEVVKRVDEIAAIVDVPNKQVLVNTAVRMFWEQ